MNTPPETASAPLAQSDVTKAIDFLADAGQQMLASSSSVSEVLDELRAVMAAVGLGDAQVDATLSSLTISYWRPDLAAPVTVMRVVHIGEPQLEQLAGTGSLLQRVEKGELDLDEAIARLHELEGQPAPRRRYVGLAVLLAAMGWVVFLDGFDSGTILAALLATLLAFPAHYFVGRLDLPSWSSTFLAALIIAAVPNLLAAAGMSLHVGPAVVGALFIYLPGRALVSSLIDGLSNAPLSSLARGLEAVVTAGILALGMLAGASLGVGFGLSYTPNTDAQPALLSVFAAGIGVLGLAIAWGMPRDQLAPSAALGAFGWLIASVATSIDVGSGWIATALAAVVVGLAGALLSTAQQTPASVYIGVAILPLVPGFKLYQGMLAVAQDKPAIASEAIGEAIVISIAIAVGVAIGLAFGRNATRIGQRARSAWRAREA